jgi:hypothetical protein
MAKEKKQLTPGVKASEVDKEILENVGSKPLFNKKAKGGLNKFMKERSGAAVTQKEADRLKKVSRSAVAGSAGEAMAEDAMKNISGASVTDAERERLQDAMPDYAEGGEVVVGKGKDYIKDLL